MTATHLGTVLLAALALLGTACGGGGGGDDPGGGDPIVVTLQNDTFADGLNAPFVTGFGAGEAIGATLGPAPVVMSLDLIRYRWGPAGVVGDFTLKVYRDTGAADPGTELVSIGRQLTSTSEPWHEFDVSSAGIILGVGQSVRFVIEYQATLSVGPGRDDDGTNTAGQNWVLTGGNWIASSSLAIPGDFIVRGIGVMAN